MSDPYDLSQGATPSSDAESGEPKIIVDSDWKAQAQAEKEKLAQEEETKQASGAGGEQPPEASFQALLRSMAMQALMYLGAFPDPETGQAVVAPEYAKHYIDLIGVLEEKTKGNLTKEEEEEMTGVLADLRSQFVRVAQAVRQHMAQQQAGGTAGAPQAGGPMPESSVINGPNPFAGG